MKKTRDSFCTRFFSALAHPLRIRILQMLILESMNVNTLTDRMHLERTLLSHNLRQLYNAELVFRRKEGKERVYYVNNDVVPHVFALMSKVVCSGCSIKKVVRRLKGKKSAEQFSSIQEIKRNPCKDC